jgi:phage repressor protein C with HTH and peptisase S24 domain
LNKRISERFSEIKNDVSLKGKGFADSIAILPQTVSDIERGKREPSKDVLLKLASKYQVNLHWMLTGEGEKYVNDRGIATTNEPPIAFPNKIKRGNPLPVYQESELPAGVFVVPLLDQRLSAGGGSFLPEKDEVRALIHVPDYLSHYGDKIAALTVDGDSMYPTLHRGDRVVCDSYGWSGEGIYALRMGGSGYVKRITKRPGKIVIISDNPKYPTQEEPEESEDIEIIGRVHCAITKLE